MWIKALMFFADMRRTLKNEEVRYSALLEDMRRQNPLSRSSRKAGGQAATLQQVFWVMSAEPGMDQIGKPLQFH